MNEAHRNFTDDDIPAKIRISEDKLNLKPIPLLEGNYGTLYKLREFFLTYNFFFIFLKIFVGGIFLIVPIFLFDRILTQINSHPDEESSSYIIAFVPLIVSISVIMLYFTGFIAYKILSMCFASFLIPTWEFRNLGNILFYLIISSGILFFILNVNECLIYIEPYPNALEAEANSMDVMNAVLAKIFLFNFFGNDVHSSSAITLTTAHRINLDQAHDCNSFMKNCKKDRVNLNVNADSNRVYSTSNSAPVSTDTTAENMILDCWVILFSSCLFICAFILIKIIFFKVKNTVYYAIMILSLLYFYIFNILNIQMNSTWKNLHKLIPIYIILFTLLIWTIVDTVNLLRSNLPYNYLNKSEKENRSLEALIAIESNNSFEKFITLIFYFSKVISYILFITVLSLTIAYVIQYNQGVTDLPHTEENNNLLRNLTLVSFLFLLFGSVYDIGKLLIDPLFYSVEKTFFMAPTKEFYYKLLFTKNQSPSLLEIKSFYTKIEGKFESNKNSHQNEEVVNVRTTEFYLNGDEEKQRMINEKEKS